MTITLDSFLAALRQHESGSNYTASNSPHGASGAYQYLDSTWANYAGYSRAKDAPKDVQDRRAREDVSRNLAVYRGDWAKVAVAHFAGAGWLQRHPNPSSWNVNPAPGSNNPTVSAYVADVLAKASGGSPGPGAAAPSSSGGGHGLNGSVTDGFGIPGIVSGGLGLGDGLSIPNPVGGIEAVGSFFGQLTKASTWVRVLYVLGGAGLLIYGANILSHGAVGSQIHSAANVAATAAIV